MEAVYAYIDQYDPRAGNRVIARFGEAIEVMTVRPQRGRPERILGTRERVVPRTPCIVAYRVVGASIGILAVLHGERLWPRSSGRREPR
nr:type II toxin-antitoxin system RelE/ParE family toxin [Methylobacterium sp. GC_Met_2]